MYIKKTCPDAAQGGRSNADIGCDVGEARTPAYIRKLPCESFIALGGRQ